MNYCAMPIGGFTCQRRKGHKNGCRVDPQNAVIADSEDELEDLRAILAELVRLKDGPRDDAYLAAKFAAWQRAREALK